MNTKLERYESLKFKIINISMTQKNQKLIICFRCATERECEQWLFAINNEIDRLRHGDRESITRTTMSTASSGYLSTVG